MPPRYPHRNQQPIDMTNMDASTAAVLQASLGAVAQQLGTQRHAITHHIGGPVGAHVAAAAVPATATGRRRSAGALHGGEEMVVLHHVPGVTGASKLLAPAAAGGGSNARGALLNAAGATKQHWTAVVRGKVAAAAAAVAAAALLRRHHAGPGSPLHPRHEQQQRAALMGVGLYKGGSVEELLQRLQPGSRHNQGARGRGAAGAAAAAAAASASVPAASSSSAAAAAAAAMGGVKGDAPALQRVRVYHGVCTWSAGQLEGELRDGMWGLVPEAAVTDVAATPPQQAWRLLKDSGRLRWL